MDSSTRSGMEERLKLDLFGKDLSQIQRYSFEENMSFVNHEPTELTPMHQNLRRITVINDLSAFISQNNILEITNTHRNREVAEIETGYRLQNEVEDLEKSHEFIRAQKEEFEKLIELLKEAENDILEVMSGIEHEDEPGEDDEQALLTHNFRELKADLKYVLETLCPEYKEDILNFLRMLEENQDEWNKVPEDMCVGAIMLLLRCKIVVQHPEQNEYFKFAPMVDI